MTKLKVLSETQYAKLLADIRGLIEEGRQRAQQLVRVELARTYWAVGKRIVQEGLSDRAGYGEGILADLSDELNIDVNTLQRSILFFKTYNAATSSSHLTWSHYKYLLALEDSDQRAWYEAQAEEKGWKVAQLANAIKEGRYQSGQGRQGAKSLKRPAKATYVYKAIVERVIDGDTLLLRVDLGFQVFKRQRVRLAAIDTPAMDQPGGREATRYVRDQLAKVDFVMVKTNKIDIYGRYVGHVFYSLNTSNKVEIFEKGRYLSQELLDRGLAVRV